MNIKKIIILLLVLPLAILVAACEQDDRIQIGILQLIEHNALTAAKDGFIDGLAEAGYVDGENITITLLNPQGDDGVMAHSSKKLVRKSDLILAIATPAALSVVNEAEDQKKNVPILFTAVTDPVSAGLIASNEKPGGNVTGTNDMNSVELQIGLIKELLPEATKIGILYTSKEPNSKIQADMAVEHAESLGLEVEVKTIADVNELQLAASLLASSVDAVYIPTDNTIAADMGTINNVVLDKKVPFIVGEANMIYAGGSATYGIDYYRLGKLTAEMAVQILKDGKNPKDIPCVGLTDFALVINKTQLDAINLVIPSVLLDKADEIVDDK